jgi:hypothetical protein
VEVQQAVVDERLVMQAVVDERLVMQAVVDERLVMQAVHEHLIQMQTVHLHLQVQLVSGVKSKLNRHVPKRIRLIILQTERRSRLMMPKTKRVTGFLRLVDSQVSR